LPGTRLPRDEAGGGIDWSADDRAPAKFTFGEMREMGARGLLIYCSDYRCSHPVTMGGDRWPDDMRLSDIEQRLVCSACGKRGANIRPDFGRNRKPVAMMGYRGGS
jgi:hypothetical protein